MTLTNFSTISSSSSLAFHFKGDVREEEARSLAIFCRFALRVRDLNKSEVINRSIVWLLEKLGNSNILQQKVNIGKKSLT